MTHQRIAIIGGGAAGFFTAACLIEKHPEADITIYERQNDVMKKVLASGGGRCNLTNSFAQVTDLKQVYPRGHKLLKGLFKMFGPEDAYTWWEEHGVKLVTQADDCVFPQCQDAHAVAQCLKQIATQHGVFIKTSHRVVKMEHQKDTFTLHFENERQVSETFHCVVVTTGGLPQVTAYDYMTAMGNTLVCPAPSLFTFNIDYKALRELMGLVVEDAIVSIPATKFKATGALLVTHWGLSGPAALRLSSYAARYAQENNYHFNIIVNWAGENNAERVGQQLRELCKRHAQKQVMSVHPKGITHRLWAYLLERTHIASDKRWMEMGEKNINRLTNTLTADVYEVEGKSAFRDEFVTAGGIATSSVSRHTLESTTCPGLYFAGEVLDIDGVTGGFNFQAAWSTAHAVAMAIASRLEA